MIHFTSDTHFGHANIIRYCNRPFSSVREMNECIIDKWNTKVSKDDSVYHIGDFGFGDPQSLKSILRQLNGKIYLIRGNHDKFQIVRDLGFQQVWPIREIKFNDQTIILCHYAMRVWNKSHRGAWQLYGHSHGTLPEDQNSLSFDVGVDANNFEPLSFDEVKIRMESKNFKSIDHHS